jgi:hypothetical protein
MRRGAITLGAGSLWLLTLALAQAATTPPPPLEPANYRDPPRQYERRSAHGWTVWVEQEMATRDAGLCTGAVARLDKKLGEMLAVLPAETHTNLQQLPIFLMYGRKANLGGRSHGAEYHQRQAPDHFQNLDPKWGRSVVIYSAENYVWLSEFWALKVLVHEFAHAYHLERWPEEQKDILEAYTHAMNLGLYRNARDLDGNILEKGYAAVNQLEYFAELSCAYFAGCHYFPFNRRELKSYDPAGYEMIRKMWNLNGK